MSLRITKITVKNFRSVRDFSLSPERMAILVGRNDCGKSNILRALNLFFNGTISPDEDFDFRNDHNVFENPGKKAKEVRITLEIEPPESYRTKNGDYVVWEKRWRAEGEFRIEVPYSGRRRITGPRGGSRLEEVKIPPKSNLHALLRNINFIYVPAIKDPEYFSELRASIHGIIAEVADEGFRKSSKAFEEAIAGQLGDLTAQITASLDIESRLTLPKDLSHIFESLDFLSKGQNISLDARGDGIKARHIPLILKFMADKRQSLRNAQGAAPYSFIWAYEEPENSLELTSSVKLADQFRYFLDDGICQIFLTTHSPVFYNLARRQSKSEDRISCHHIYHDTDKEGTRGKTGQISDLDEHMGTTALFAPMVAEFEDKIRREEKANAEAERLANNKRCRLFVEGPSDQEIMKKAISVFAPDDAGNIDIETKDNGGGVNYVVDMMKAWRHQAKHHPELPRAAGLLDQDEKAKKEKWNGGKGNVKSVKCFQLSPPPHLYKALNAGFRVPVVLETLYDKKAWEWADEQGHLAERDPCDFVPKNLFNLIANNKSILKDHLDKDWAIYVEKTFLQEGKMPMAKHFAGKSDDEFRQRLACLENLVTEIVSYLKPQS